MKKFVFLTGAVVLLLALAAVTVFARAQQPAAPRPAQAAGSLEGTRWILVSYVNKSGNTTNALQDMEPTAEFKDGRVAGSAGCNRYNGPYQMQGNKLTIGPMISTMMACPAAIMAQEQAFLANMEATASYQLSDGQLSLASKDGKALLTFKAEQPTPLTGGAWAMLYYNNGKGGAVSALADTKVTAIFGQDGQMSGSAGCNTYSAAYTLNGSNIQIGPAATTRMSCAPEVMDQERQYLTALQTAATYKIAGKTLELRTDAGALAASYNLADEAAAAPPAPAPVAATIQPTQTVTTTQPAPAPIAAGVQPTQTVTTTAPLLADLKDTYVTIRPAASSAEAITLRLNPDGTVDYTSSFGPDEKVVEKGAWKDNGDGTLTVTLTDKGDQKLANPVTIKFQKDGAYLTAVEYDKAIYGEQGLKLSLAAAVARKINAAMVTIDLEAGFPLDPTFVSVQAGGTVDASVLGKGCSGFINAQPVVTVKWTGQADRVKVFFYSDDDPTLVVLTPKGELVCSDNLNEQVLDPQVELKDPAPGTYRIFIGSAAKNQLIPGVLVLTTKSEVNVGSFQMSKLIKRPELPDVVVKPTPLVDAATVQDAITALTRTATELKPGVPTTAAVTAEGDVPLFQFPVTKTCAGLVSPKPSYVFKVTDQTKLLNVFFESDSDAALLVLGDGGKIVECSDDVQTGVNINPQVRLENPPAGAYAVFVGRLNPAQPVKGTLTITDSADAAPATLAPIKK